MATPFAENIQATRSRQAAERKQQAELSAMIREMRKTQAASLAGSSKPSVILTDQTDLGDKIKELTTRTVQAINGLDMTEDNKAQLTVLTRLSGDLKNLSQSLDSLQNSIESQTSQIVGALHGLELNPQITVPTPNVTVNEKAIDFKPLQKSIDALKTTKALSLADFRAHDLDDAPDGSQYVGYIALDGSWYIIHSNDASNSMRYCFGKSDYAQAWGDRWTHTYTTLSEAIHALAT